jgi:hypothetical protein
LKTKLKKNTTNTEVIKILKLAACLQQIFAKLKIGSYLIPLFFTKPASVTKKYFPVPDLVITF